LLDDSSDQTFLSCTKETKMENVHQYLSQHTKKSTLSRCVAQLCESLDGTCDVDALNDSILNLVCDAVYTSNISKAPKDFISGTDEYPIIRTTHNYALKQASSHTLSNRKNCIRQIYKALGSDKPIYDATTGTYAWIHDTAAVVAATQKAYTIQSTFNLAWGALLCFCEALGLPELKQQYYELFSALPPISTEDSKRVLSKTDLKKIRKLNGGVCNKAMAYLSAGELKPSEWKVVCDALCIETLYGCDLKHEPLRRDWPNVKFAGPSTDKHSDNYITVGDTVTLTVTHANKKGKLAEPVSINLTEASPRLAILLKALYPVACKAHNTEEPWVFTSYTGPTAGQKMSESCFSSRMTGVWERLGFVPPKGMRGCNGARHASVAESRKRRRLTPDEQEALSEQAKRRLHKASTADAHYG
jgi:hypothetical protein